MADTRNAFLSESPHRHPSNRKAAFVEPMECAPVSKLADGSQWVYEIKFDGYRAIAVKSDGKVTLFSKRRKSFNRQFPHIVEALADLPESTVVDGEVVAFDESGRPDFNGLQNFRAAASNVHYFVFDLLIHKNRDLTRLPLMERRVLMRTVLKLHSPRVHISDYFETSAADMLRAVREQGLEGVVAKRRDSIYEEGKRTGAWAKYRVNRGQEFVIGGYIPGPHGLDSIIMGYCKREDLVYVARVRNGLVPASRRQVFQKLRGRAVPECPFINLPESLAYLRAPRRLVLFQVSAINGISQTLIPGAHLANLNLTVGHEDGAARIVQKRSIPTVRLCTPGTDGDAISHHDKPDADKSMLGVANTDAQAFSLPERRQDAIGKLLGVFTAGNPVRL